MNLVTPKILNAITRNMVILSAVLLSFSNFILIVQPQASEVIENQNNENKLGAANFYTLEMSRNQSVSAAREQASIASGLVPFRCRVLNQVGTFVVHCGKSNDANTLSPTLKKLHSLGLDSVTIKPVEEKSVVLFNYEPITLDEKSQLHLLEMAQQRQLFQLNQPTPKSEVIDLAKLLKEEEQTKQATYFVDRGWSALAENDLPFALNMFELAAQIPIVELEAKYGAAIVYQKQENWSKAFFLLEELFNAQYTEPNLAEQTINAAFNANEFIKASFYIDSLPKEKRLAWRKRLKAQDIILEMSEFSSDTDKVDIIAFRKKYQYQLDECNPFTIWLDHAETLKKRKMWQERNIIYLALFNGCRDFDQVKTMLYKLKPLLSERKLIEHITSAKTQFTKLSELRQLTNIHIETLLQLAAKFKTDLQKQKSIIDEALSVKPSSFNANLLLGWNTFHREDYKTAESIFLKLWQSSKSKKALEGYLYSLAALKKSDKAISLARANNMNKPLVVLFKQKLSELDKNDRLSLDTARLILQYEPLYKPAYSAIAWYFFNQQQWKNSEQAFNDWLVKHPNVEEAEQGVILSVIKQQDFDRAREKARSLKYSAVLLLMIDEEEAVYRFNHNQYSEAIQLLLKVRYTRKLPAYLHELLAWSFLRTKQWLLAETEFRLLYKQQETPEFAQAIITCLAEQKKADELKIFYKEIALHPNTKIRRLAAIYYANNDKVIYGAFLDPVDSSQTYHNNQRAWAGLKYSGYDFTETTALANYEHSRFQLDLGIGLADASHVELTILSDKSTPNDLLSHEDVGSSYLDTTARIYTLEESYKWGYLSLASNKDAKWGGNVGKSPIIKGLESSWLFGAFYQSDWGRVQFQRAPLFETALSFAGYADPYADQYWGAVLKDELSYYYQKDIENFWWNIILGLSQYDGTNVIENEQQKLSAALGQTTLWQQINMSYGLFLDLQQFDKDSNHFTFGHGGYFSPQSLFAIGPFASLESQTRNWWKVDAGLSYFDWSTDSIEQYPLNPQLTDRFTAASKSGLGFQFKAEKHWLISNHWEAALGVSWMDSPQYQRRELHFVIRYLFGTRKWLTPKKSVFLRPEQTFDHLP